MEIDLKTQAWLDDVRLYRHGNCCDLDELRRRVSGRSEWSERLRRNFRHVLTERPITAARYDDETFIDFDSDDDFLDYLTRPEAFLFNNGPYPEIE